MANLIIETIAKYWVTEICLLTVAGISWLIKRYVEDEKLRKENDRKKLVEEIKASVDVSAKIERLLEEVNEAMASGREESKNDDEKLQQQINNTNQTLEALRVGVLSIQGRAFKKNCDKLLEQDHELTSKEYLQLNSDHIAYNALGGNHDGDALFKLIETKAVNTFGQAFVDEVRKETKKEEEPK